jgi:hypothetical protein
VRLRMNHLPSPWLSSEDVHVDRDLTMTTASRHCEKWLRRDFAPLTFIDLNQSRRCVETHTAAQ